MSGARHRAGEWFALALVLCAIPGCYASHGRAGTPVDPGPGEDASPPDGGLRDATVRDATARDAAPGDAGPIETGPPEFAVSVRSAFLRAADGRFWGAATSGNRTETLGEPRRDAPPGVFGQYTGPVRFRQLAATEVATCGIARDRTVYCWGRNVGGLLGRDIEGASLEPPTPVEGPRMVQLTAGRIHFCGLTEPGELYCWGVNEGRQLGSTVGFSPTPARVETELNWRQVDGGDAASCGVTVDGSLYCWGTGEAGQLGNGSALTSAEPVQVGVERGWAFVDVGIEQACGIQGPERRLFCWGRVSFGEPPAQPTEVGGTNWESVSVGQFHVCGIRDTEGFCWGINRAGEVGVDTPNPNVDEPTSLGTGWSSITSSWEFTCGVRDGSPLCWGRLFPTVEDDRREPLPIALDPSL